MRVISFDSARVTLLFPFEEIIPDGGIAAETLLSAIKTRYNFSVLPDPNVPREELEKNGIKFENATFKTGRETVNVGRFTIHTDGVVIDAKTTMDGELFLDDLIDWIRIEHSFKYFISKPRRRFLSQIVVEFDQNLSRIMGAHEKITSAISVHLSRIYEEAVPIGLLGFGFDYDRVGKNSSLVVPRFSLERRAGIPFERERYYCMSPLRTADHLEMLQLIESCLA
jgi:hypothetical protein